MIGNNEPNDPKKFKERFYVCAGTVATVLLLVLILAVYWRNGRGFRPSSFVSRLELVGRERNVEPTLRAMVEKATTSNNAVTTTTIASASSITTILNAWFANSWVSSRRCAVCAFETGDYRRIVFFTMQNETSIMAFNPTYRSVSEPSDQQQQGQQLQPANKGDKNRVFVYETHDVCHATEVRATYRHKHIVIEYDDWANEPASHREATLIGEDSFCWQRSIDLLDGQWPCSERHEL